MSELYVLTFCGYRVQAGTVCFGSINVRKEQCQKCLIYHKKRPRSFYTNTPTFSSKKVAVVKVHPFGVTVTPRIISRTEV